MSQGAECISVGDLCKCFNADAHPRVTSREKQAQTVADDFCKAIEDKALGGMVNEVGFCDYYLDLNCVLPAERETYFSEVVVRTWGLNANIANVHSSRIAQIETIIFEKVRQRTHGADDEGKTAKRIFKHFDLNGNGVVASTEFAQALETIGCVFPEHEMNALFNKIDRNGSGKLDYEEFSAWFAMQGTGNNPNVNPVFGLKREPPHQVLEKIRNTVLAKQTAAASGYRSLSNLFR